MHRGTPFAATKGACFSSVISLPKKMLRRYGFFDGLFHFLRFLSSPHFLSRCVGIYLRQIQGERFPCDK